jgi:hypothetical protein
MNWSELSSSQWSPTQPSRHSQWATSLYVWKLQVPWSPQSNPSHGSRLAQNASVSASVQPARSPFDRTHEAQLPRLACRAFPHNSRRFTSGQVVSGAVESGSPVYVHAPAAEHAARSADSSATSVSQARAGFAAMAALGEEPTCSLVEPAYHHCIARASAGARRGVVQAPSRRLLRQPAHHAREEHARERRTRSA